MVELVGEARIAVLSVKAQPGAVPTRALGGWEKLFST